MNYKLVAMLLMLASVVGAACKEGYVPTDVEGVCQKAGVTETNPEWVSDEKPPEDKMPSWQREGVTVIDAPSTTAQDEEIDRAKAESDEAVKRIKKDIEKKKKGGKK